MIEITKRDYGKAIILNSMRTREMRGRIGYIDDVVCITASDYMLKWIHKYVRGIITPGLPVRTQTWYGDTAKNILECVFSMNETLCG